MERVFLASIGHNRGMKIASFFTCIVVLSSFVAACGDDTDPGETGGATSSTGQTTTHATTATSSAASGTSSTQSATSTSSGGDFGVTTPTLGASTFAIDCMPVVADDPISGSVSLTYENDNPGAQTFTIEQIVLHLSKDADTLDWTFDVDPDTSGPIPAGQSVTIEHMKVADSGVGTPGGMSPCAFCGGDASIDVNVVASGTAFGGHVSVGGGVGRLSCDQ